MNKILQAFALFAVISQCQAQITPFNYDTPSYIEFEAGGYLVSEDATNLVMTVFRYGEYRQACSVDFSTSEGTATEGQDYKGVGGTLVFPAGQSVKTILIPIIADIQDEVDEEFTVEFSNPSPNAELGQTSATVVIQNVAPALEIPALAIAAGGNGSIVLSWPDDGNSYVIERCANCISGMWEAASSSATLENGVYSLREAATGINYFYRLRAE